MCFLFQNQGSRPKSARHVLQPGFWQSSTLSRCLPLPGTRFINSIKACKQILQLFSWDPLYLPQRYVQMYLFRQGHARRARNVMIGHLQGQQLRLFDYLYETGLGPHRHTHQFSVVTMQVSHDLPGLLVQTKAKPKVQYNLTAMDQIELPGATDKQGPAVFCQKIKFAQDYISEEMLQNLTQCQGASLEVQNGVLALYVPDKLTVAKYRQLRGLANETAEYLAGYKPQADKN